MSEDEQDDHLAEKGAVNCCFFFLFEITTFGDAQAFPSKSKSLLEDFFFLRKTHHV